MLNLNQEIKAKAAPGVIEVIEWALLVHKNTMDVTTGTDADGTVLTSEVVAKRMGRYTLCEREEARKILLEYGAGKPTRIVEHRGSRKDPIRFETEIVRAKGALPEATIDAEILNETPNP